MLSVDKHHSWDRIRKELLLAGMVDGNVWIDGETVEKAVKEAIQSHRTFTQLQTIGNVAPEKPLFTDEQLAELLILVRIAVWIRSEQLAHPNAVLNAPLQVILHDPVVAEVDTHNMNVTRARAEFEAGQRLFRLLADYTDQHAIGVPSWVK